MPEHLLQHCDRWWSPARRTAARLVRGAEKHGDRVEILMPELTGLGATNYPRIMRTTLLVSSGRQNLRDRSSSVGLIWLSRPGADPLGR